MTLGSRLRGNGGFYIATLPDSMRVAILHNEVSPDASEAERDVLVQVEVVAAALARMGHEAAAVPVSLDLERLRRQLDARRPDVAFNLVESLGGSDRLMFLPTALLDVMQIPYTGSPTEAILTAGDKPAAKRRLTEAGLPTPGWMEGSGFRVQGSGKKGRGDSDQAHRLRPVGSGRGIGSQLFSLNSQPKFIIKPVWEHASLGMDAGSVVSVADADALAGELGRRIAASGRRCFAEEFVDGREFNLSLLASRDGAEVLPPAEIDFSAFPAGVPRIVGYAAKWDDQSAEFHGTPRTFELAAAEKPLVDELSALAKACWDVFGLRGYARVDFRVDQSGRPWILEINANPCLSPDAGFAAATERASIGFDRAIERILEAT